MPTVSVVIPTYNRAHLLKRAIQSVLNQTYQDFELIIVNDGSTDETEEVIKTFADDRISYIRHDKNRGMSIALNSGLERARGEFIAFQDSDDEWIPNKLERQMEVFKNLPEHFGVIYTSFVHIKGDRRKLLPPSPKSGYIYSDILKERDTCWIAQPSVLIRKECFEKVGFFDENLPSLLDWDMWLRLSKHYHFYHLNEVLCKIHESPTDSLIFDRRKFLIAEELVFKKYLESMKQDPKILAKHYFYMGNSSCQVGLMKQGRKYLLRSVRTRPWDIKCLAALILACLGANLYKRMIQLKRALIKRVVYK